MNTLVVENVSAGYDRAEVLRDVSLSIGQRETVVLLGPNGSGKSTVARTIMNLTALYRGTIHWEGEDITSYPTWRRAKEGIGYVPQLNNVFPSLTVEENMRLGVADLPAREQRRRIEEMYERFPLIRARQRVTAGNLSGGERRILAFAATLIQQPRLLLLDEPSSDLAPSIVDEVFDRVRAIRDDLDLPLLLIEQNVEEALALAHRVCILVSGRIVADRAADSITLAEIGDYFLRGIEE